MHINKSEKIRKIHKMYKKQNNYKYSAILKSIKFKKLSPIFAKHIRKILM